MLCILYIQYTLYQIQFTKLQLYSWPTRDTTLGVTKKRKNHSIKKNSIIYEYVLQKAEKKCLPQYSGLKRSKSWSENVEGKKIFLFIFWALNKEKT